MLWNGIDVDVWGPIQSFMGKRPKMTAHFYTGYDIISSWQDIIPNIPLDIRYASFKERLSRKNVTPSPSDAPK